MIAEPVVLAHLRVFLRAEAPLLAVAAVSMGVALVCRYAGLVVFGDDTAPILGGAVSTALEVFAVGVAALALLLGLGALVVAGLWLVGCTEIDGDHVRFVSPFGRVEVPGTAVDTLRRADGRWTLSTFAPVRRPNDLRAALVLGWRTFSSPTEIGRG